MAVAVATELGLDLPPLPLLSRWGAPDRVDLAPGTASPRLLGEVYEQLLPPARRRAEGAHYTPASVASHLAQLTLGAAGEHPSGPTTRDGVPRVLDPACGGGALLLAVADLLAGDGADRELVAASLHGVDVDPVAAAVAEASIAIWCGGQATGRIHTGDALAGVRWPDADVIVANPPFLGQLATATSRSPELAARLRARWGAAVGGYADTAAVFLLAIAESLPMGGCAGVVVPESLLAARDAARARSQVSMRADVVACWSPGERVFEAASRVCVLVLRRHAGAAVLPAAATYDGMPPRRAGTVPVSASTRTWSPLLARAVPEVDLGRRGVIGDVASATAGFRDEYYGLAHHVHEAGEEPTSTAPLVTSGLIDPAACHWGERPARYAHLRWRAPVVDLDALGAADTRLRAWVEARLVPKILVSTQTRVVEAVVDEEGRWVPLTPVIAVTCAPEMIWHIASALLAPPVSAWALRHLGGAALAPDALRLRARDVLTVPLPAVGASWDGAAAAVRAASGCADRSERRRLLLAAAEHSCEAYGAAGTVLEWWAGRLPAT